MSEEITPAMTWKPVAGYGEHYEVSDSGEVRRVSRLDSLGRPRRIGTLKQSTSQGYRHVSLSKDDVVRTMRVHRMVACAFLGPCPNGLVTNHKDGVKTNNAPSNLEYITPLANRRHADGLGLTPTGERHGRSKALVETVIKMRRLSREGAPYALIARLYGMHPEHVRKIVRGEAWTQVPLLPPEDPES